MKNLREERIKEYAKMEGPAGESSEKENLDYWAARAKANSYHGVDASYRTETDEKGTTDPNHVGGSFMKTTRRQA